MSIDVDFKELLSLVNRAEKKLIKLRPVLTGLSGGINAPSYSGELNRYAALKLYSSYGQKKSKFRHRPFLNLTKKI